jgi:hypothetical protein
VRWFRKACSCLRDCWSWTGVFFPLAGFEGTYGPSSTRSSRLAALSCRLPSEVMSSDWAISPLRQASHATRFRWEGMASTALMSLQSSDARSPELPAGIAGVGISFRRRHAVP